MGQVIAGRFELVEPLARGGQGTVWVAWDRARDRRCAAKVLDQRDSAALLRFVREQGVQVDHPHLASPYGWAAEDHEVAIAMPLVAGGSLEGALADHGALSEPLVARLLLQLLDGLAALHAAGWVHRDVKPANILLEPTGLGEPHARLGDMGLAMRVDDARLTVLGALHGTPGFVSPEAAAGEHPAPAQDLWAAGATAVRLLAPQVALDDDAAVDAVLAGVMTVELAQAIGREGLLSPNPEDRSAAAAAAPALLRESTATRRPDGGFVTAAQEPFEVFDQTGGLHHEDESAGDQPTEELPTEDLPAEDLPTEHPGGETADSPARSPGPVWLGLVLVLLGAVTVLVAVAMLAG
ncbi:serine/threonine protein kinase [Micrococcus luteus]|uniref:serine/threonine-protein kinase n=1 Tax=Micrococcus luteus TaxID=1270 RepID=UPI0019105951|nr:serine/threonine-protein kinase [Micrococcus luteus]QQE49364.1 serine/threonine protein kinase [Micrococcus luteus]